MKENGRLSPAENKEMAELKSKMFKCNSCGAEIPVKNPEFGKRMVCPECDNGTLEEVIE